MLDETALIKKAADLLENIHLAFGPDELAFLECCAGDAITTVRNKFAYLLQKEEEISECFVVSSATDNLELNIMDDWYWLYAWTFQIGYMDVDSGSDVKRLEDIIGRPDERAAPKTQQILLNEQVRSTGAMKVLLLNYSAEQEPGVALASSGLLQERRRLALVFNGVKQKMGLDNAVMGFIPAGNKGGLEVEIFYMVFPAEPSQLLFKPYGGA